MIHHSRGGHTACVSSELLNPWSAIGGLNNVEDHSRRRGVYSLCQADFKEHIRSVERKADDPDSSTGFTPIKEMASFHPSTSSG